ncbi:DUF6624 domain-containing protein [Pseudoduganella armeniaca]|uniref:Uncharacterized protein n=1 Tax=Pseudoduganella armeniaca TaxID=2072590 RepID=A0A2R4C9R2_9BURK|nr:DUF6624 domain-containing protein [Pseudoduganella armeniaca]AVR96270.1 hypothetical protein C9I28_11555 [Pseudoduganella armeniaca]
MNLHPLLRRLSVLAWALCAGTAALAQPVAAAENGLRTPREPALRAELLAMMAQDQSTLDLQTSDPQAFEAIQAHFQERINGIVAQHGWPTVSLVGEDGAKAAWLLVQHRDADRPYQLRILELMAPLVKTGEVSDANYAYLYDRTHRPQRYGTQGRCVREGRGGWEPFIIEDLPALHERRRDMGLPPIADYAARFSCPATAVAFLAGAGPTVPVPKDP